LCAKYGVEEGARLIGRWDDAQAERAAATAAAVAKTERLNAAWALCNRIDHMTATSPFLSSQDFDAYMREVEREMTGNVMHLWMGGQLKTSAKRLRTLKRHPGCSGDQREDADNLLDEIRAVERDMQQMAMEAEMHRMRLEIESKLRNEKLGRLVPRDRSS
jgi:hypothetical protein